MKAVKMMSTVYQNKRPYRYKNDKNIFFRMLMEERFREGFSDYWEQFGYEIGGPVCYAYVRWLMDAIAEEDLSSIAFVARDGWLLKQVYQMLATHERKTIRYVYAPRSVFLLSQGKYGQESYTAYLNNIGIGNGKIAVVDSVTIKFSSLRLISAEGRREAVGFFWHALSNADNYRKNFHYYTYQKEHYHIIDNWNVIEFILSSPEPPIEALHDGKPIYQRPTDAERLRESLFPSIQKGVLAFVEDVLREGSRPQITYQKTTEWVNGFLRNPNGEDIAAFKPIRFSERSDHTDSIPLDPFGLERKSIIKRYKERLWFLSQEHPNVYAVLHAGKVILKCIIQTVQSRGAKVFNGGNLNTVLDAAANADIISFDIFDTLLLRPYEKPTDLFYVLEQDSGLIDFHDNRIKAEQYARQSLGKPGGEINLSDICHLLAKNYGLDAETLEKQEIEKEMEVCHPNSCFLALVEELERAGKPMVATSDMYLPSDALRRLLDKNGFSMIQQIFVSNEYGAGKHDGSLQKKVWEILGREKKILHIGDNFFSDVKKSKEVGWKSIWYRR